MHDYGALSDASQTVVHAMRHGLSDLQPPATAELHRLDETPGADPARMTAFLFEVFEDPHTRNRPTTREGNLIRRAPLGLTLRFLVTPWGGDVETELRLLGRTLQYFHDNAILAGPTLRGGLAGSDAALKVTPSLLRLEDHTRIWQAVQKPYRLSATLEVKVIRIRSDSTTPVTPVRTRDQVSGQAR